ncbi:MAG: hypothetical protein LBP38_06220 [Desulfovibrio sp.]|jgi:type I restriction enzyme S subunit|nr:hypothetical protein [Desulfovibrio sp.]
MWFDSVPLRALITPASQKNRPDLPLLSVVREKGVILRSRDKSENHNTIPDDLSGYKVVHSGQFVINKMKAWQGSCGVYQYDGIVSPAYFVFDLHEADPCYFNYTIRSHHFVGEFGRISNGIRVGQWDLSMDALKYVRFPLPSHAEQDQIVRFLDWKVSQVNRLSRTLCGKSSIDPKDLERYKKSQISLLIEYRTRLISDVVTGKLDVRDVAVPEYEAVEETAGYMPCDGETDLPECGDAGLEATA